MKMHPHVVKYSEGFFSHCPRAGYLTLFNSTDDVTAIYKEFRKFDKLLSKLVHGSLTKGKLIFLTPSILLI